MPSTRLPLPLLCALSVLCADAATTTATARQPFASPNAVSHEPPTRDFDLQHLEAEITLYVDQGRMTGRTTQTFAAIRKGQNRLTLNQVDLEITSLTDGDGRALDYRTDGHDLHIDLASAPAIGQPFKLVIAYAAEPRAGLWFIRPDKSYPNKAATVWTQGEMEDTRYWLPTWDYPNDRTTTALRITVPATWSAVSNGRLVSVRDGDGTRTFHWSQDEPHVTYLISIAAGEFDVERATSLGGVELAYWVPKGRADDIARSFAKTPAMLDFFAEWTGVPYPWAKYDQVVVTDYIFGGMENTSATTLTDATLHDERAHHDFPSDGLVAHEAAHQWWGDLVTCESWSHNWLNEGFATYFEVLWTEHDLGRDEHDYNMLRKADSYFEEDGGKYRRPIVTSTYDSAIDLFDSHAYSKGSLVLRMLRYLLGDDEFQRGIRAWTVGHRGRVVETDELRLALEESTGRPLDWFFDQWLFGPGHPEYSIESSWESLRGAVTVRISQTQSTEDGTARFRMPLVVRVWDEREYRDHRIDVRGNDQIVYLNSATEPLAITIDPGNNVLAKVDYERSIEAVAVQLTRSPLAVDRILATRELGSKRSRKSTMLLRTALTDDGFWGVRAEAAHALGRTRGDGAREALEAGLGDTDSRVRAAVCKSLGKLKDAAAIALLKDRLNDDSSYAVRAEAAFALALIGGDGAMKQLERALDQESHREVVRAKALEGIGELVDPGDKKALTIATRWSAYGQPSPARDAAIALLGKIGKGNKQARETLVAIAADDPWLVARRSALQALGKLGDAAAIDTLELAARSEIDGRLRRTAREALHELRAGSGEGGMQRQLDELRERQDSLERTVADHAASLEQK